MRGWISRIGLLAFACGGALASGSISASATTVFTDGAFNDISVSTLTSGPTTVTVQTPCPTCGTAGGQGLGITVDDSASGVTTTSSVGAIENAFSYNPATQGVITSIDASVEKDVAFTGPASSYTNTFHPLILQSGNYYMASIPMASVNAPGDSGYIASSQTGLTANDFALYSFLTGTLGSSHPDFAGAPLQLGLATIAELLAGTVANINFDDLRFQVNAVAPAQTPIPGALPLLVTALGAMGVMARRRKPSAVR